MKKKNRISLTIVCYALVFTFFQVKTVAASHSFEKKPKWTEYQYRNNIFPHSQYVIGFASEENNNDETRKEIFDRLSGYARGQLVESIHVSVKSLTTSSVIIENEATADYFRQTSMSLSKINIAGLITDTYFDEEENVLYAIAYAKKSDVSNLYHNKIEKLKQEINQKIENAENYSEENNTYHALKNYYECMPLFREIEEAYTLVTVFEGTINVDSEQFFDEINQLKVKVTKALDALHKNEHLALDDVCYSMAYSLKMQIGNTDIKVQIANFSYKDSEMGSLFSRRLSASLEQKFTQQGIQVIHISANSINSETIQKAGILGGTYWKEDSLIRIIGILHDHLTGKTIGSIETTLPVRWLTSNNIAYIPGNYNKTISEIVTINNEIIVSEGGLHIELNTNHGNNNPMYTKGDTMALYIKANQDCYLRFMYYFADGTKVLLLDNYYIDKQKVNKYYQIPQLFECVAPFGVERIHLIAQSEPFKPLRTQNMSGHELIIDELDEVLANIRAFNPVDNNDAKAEKTLIITTLPK